MKISLIIITTGKNKYSLERLFKSIAKQTCANCSYELVLATESSGFELENLAKQLLPFIDDVIVVETGYWNRCRTANLAILRSKGELVALLEDDLELDPQWLSEVIKVFNIHKDAKSIGCVYSMVINPFGSESVIAKMQLRSPLFSLIAKIINMLRVHYHFARRNLSVFSLAVVCRREALLRAGLFDSSVEEPIVAEDYDLALRIQKSGYKIVMCSKAEVLHYTCHVYKRALLTLKKGPMWWGRIVENDTYFFAKHRDLLGIVILTHALYNAFISPLALIPRLKGYLGLRALLELFLYSIKGSFTGLIKGALKSKPR
jgi:GT2 family glycosyltransferase